MQHLSSVTVVVPDYDEAIAFDVAKLGFSLAEATPISATKRWVVVMPPGATQTGLLLAKADGPEQHASIGAHSGGGVFLILKTNDCDRDYARFVIQGIEFLEAPRPRGLPRGGGFQGCLCQYLGPHRAACQKAGLGSSLKIVTSRSATVE